MGSAAAPFLQDLKRHFVAASDVRAEARTYKAPVPAAPTTSQAIRVALRQLLRLSESQYNVSGFVQSQRLSVCS